MSTKSKVSTSTSESTSKSSAKAAAPALATSSKMVSALKAAGLTGLKVQSAKLPDGAFALNLASHGVIIERATDSQLKSGGFYNWTIHTRSSFESGLDHGQLAAFWADTAPVTWVKKHEAGLLAAVKAGEEYTTKALKALKEAEAAARVAAETKARKDAALAAKRAAKAAAKAAASA